MLKLFSFNITQEEKIVMWKIANIFDCKFEIIDLQSFDPQVSSVDNIITFGDRAAKLCKLLKPANKLQLTDVSKLSSGFGDPIEREEAWQQLQLYNKQLDNKATEEVIVKTTTEKLNFISDQDLPEINNTIVLEHLEKVLNQKAITEWVLRNKNNKIIRVTIEPEKSNADIDITFSELFALTSLMQLAKGGELEIVYAKSASEENNN